MSPVELALFPLSNVVLFPGVQAPLHLFEPRYRQMADEVLASGAEIGMVAVPPEYAAAMEGDPPLYPVGCAGAVARSRRLPDGRYDIVLLGTRRFRILREIERPAERLYRVAEVESFDDPCPPGTRQRVEPLRERIVGLVRTLVEMTDRERAGRITPELFHGVDDPTFVNSLCQGLGFAPQEKQGLLEAADVPTRFERLEGLLTFRLAELSGPGPAGSDRLH